MIGRIVELKAETAARAIKIVLPEGTSLGDFPPGVSLQPGLLSIAFKTQEELLEQLFLLARALASHPELLSSFSGPPRY